jgi:hypothetical protein
MSSDVFSTMVAAPTLPVFIDEVCNLTCSLANGAVQVSKEIVIRLYLSVSDVPRDGAMVTLRNISAFGRADKAIFIPG